MVKYNKFKLLAFLLFAILLFSFNVEQALAGWNHLVTSYKWQSTSITYDFDSISWPTNNSDWNNRVHNSASKWSAISSLKFSYSGLSFNDWYYRYIDDITTIAQTRTTLNNGVITEVNTDVNNRLSFYAGTGTPSPTQYDLYSVILHEFGHWYHLEDDYTHDSPVMYWTLSYAEVKRNLTTEDTDAAKYMYP